MPCKCGEVPHAQCTCSHGTFDISPHTILTPFMYVLLIILRRHVYTSQYVLRQSTLSSMPLPQLKNLDIMHMDCYWVIKRPRTASLLTASQVI